MCSSEIKNISIYIINTKLTHDYFIYNSLYIYIYQLCEIIK